MWINVSMIRVINIGELADDCFTLLKTEMSESQVVNILLKHPSMNRVQGAAGDTSGFGRIVLILRIHQGTARIHDPGYTLSSVIHYTRMIKSQRMPVFMSSRGGAFV